MSVLLETPKSKTALLWGGALLGSFLLHLALFEMNPRLLTKAGDSTLARTERQQAILNVQPPEPEVLRQELPRLFETELPEEPFVESGGADVPNAEDVMTTPTESPIPEVEAVGRPAELVAIEVEETSATTWSPREEVLSITDPRIQDVLDDLPRSFREVETTRPHAPDIILPTDIPDIDVRQDSVSASVPSMDVSTAEISVSEAYHQGTLQLEEVSPEIPGSLLELPELENEFTQDEEVLLPTEQLLQLMVQVHDPEDEPDARYFKIQLKRNGIESLPAIAKDVVFIIDCSASMTREKLNIALKGIRASLDTIDEPDRIQVITFRGKTEMFASEPQPATLFGKAQVQTFLSSLRAYGQTDVFESLKALQEMPIEPKRPVLALVITDGIPTQGVMDTGKILDQFSRVNEGRISMFGLGGGRRVNRQLLDFLSFRNRGFSLISPRGEGLARGVERMVSEVNRPVLTNVDVRFSGTSSSDIYPKSLSHLYVDRPWILIGRTSRSTDRLAFQVVGSSLDSTHDIVFDVQLSSSPQGQPSLQQEWAWQAGLEKWAVALEQGSEEALQEAVAFFRRYDLDVPNAYKN